MPTLKQIIRDMIARAPGQILGRTEAIASLTSTTCVVTRLNQGGRSVDDFIGKYLCRMDTATAADRERRVVNFATATGTLTHSGANYSDTTATGESVDILTFEPRWYADAVQVSLGRLLRLSREEYPTINNQSVYPIYDLSWVKDPGDIIRVAYSNNPITTRDRYMEKWGTINSSGIPQLDWWTLAGTSATYARSTTNAYRRQYSVAVTRSGTDCTLGQTGGLLQADTPASRGEDLRGKPYVAALLGVSSVASQLRVQWNDGVNTVSSAYHTGAGGREELSASGTIASTATSLTVRASIEGNNTVCYVNQIYGLSPTLDDGARHGLYQEYEVPREIWDQASSSLELTLPRYGMGGQYVVYSRRPFPKFDSDRIAANTADGDITDAPLEVIATMALGRLFDGLKSNPGENHALYAQLAADWVARGDRLASMFLAQRTHPKGGVFLPHKQLGMFPMPRWR